MTQISEEVYRKLADDYEVERRLVLALVRHFHVVQKTAQNWIQSRSIILTTVDALAIITLITGIPEERAIIREPIENLASI